MQWFNHILIAGSTTAVVNPNLIPLAVIGATAPDWLEKLARSINYPINHRGVTHYFSLWLITWLLCIPLDPSALATAFFYGGFTHVLMDAMTVTGVPFSPLSDRRFHLFGGRFRTGDNAEYFISVSVFIVCAGIIFFSQSHQWSPFFIDWPNLYNKGVIDAQEWRQNRFRFF